ncbi:hypothetical protein DSAG12_03885 [Promethearchaeum syntrophicum]|uniref:Uncharacterized protein n=1 Tax=Promethearchaeum syntrophicum TaxID=2594042 RepID=A0A5B9DH94_9ARCH|nr:hypothetical protein [Candidatus Prometheoarchaeum syntrophicum]QEE18047.1 hypothetical protein DSAG12_03885 [Candidatus Prometheoarchaeum syntrophicum]
MIDNSVSNFDLIYPKESKLNNNPEKMFIFSVLTYFIVIGLFLILSASGVVEFIPNYESSRIIILVFAISWNSAILIIIVGLLINSNKNIKINSENFNQYTQEYQSQRIEMEQITRSHDYLSPQFIETKKKLIRAFYIMSFFLSFVFLLLLAIGILLILYSVGIFDFGLENPSFNIIRSIFAGIWNISLFFAFNKIIKSFTRLQKKTTKKFSFM